MRQWTNDEQWVVELSFSQHGESPVSVSLLFHFVMLWSFDHEILGLPLQTLLRMLYQGRFRTLMVIPNNQKSIFVDVQIESLISHKYIN